MPMGSLQSPTHRELSVNHLLELRAKYQVSSEAIFLKFAGVKDPLHVYRAERTRGLGHVLRRMRLSMTSFPSSPAANILRSAKLALAGAQGVSHGRRGNGAHKKPGS